MTISSEVFKKIYTGNDSTTVFPYTFKIFADTDLEVILYTVADGTETVLSLTTHYTVSDAGEDAGGNVTTVETYSSDYQIIIRRNLTYTQGTDYIENDPFAAETHETALDRLTMLVQQSQEQLDRTLIQSSSATNQIKFPTPSSDRLIGWNTAADALENKSDPSAAAAVSAAAAASSASEAATSAAAASGVAAVFTDSSLAAGVLTITHSLGLDAPYILDFAVMNNSNQLIDPDSVTFAANSITVDLGSYGTLTGNWAYLYGGSPTSDIPLPDPTGEVALNLVRVNAGQTAYETVAPAYIEDVVEDTTPQLGGDLDLNGNNIDFPTTANISDCLDEDDMATDSATMLATQQSIKAYVDAQAKGIQLFTSNGTFNVPAGITKVYLTMVGGGGGGGGVQGSGTESAAGGGGAGESVVNLPYTVTPAAALAVVVGAGGAGGVGVADGADGADSTFNAAITAAKGLKGVNATGSRAGGVGGGSALDGADGSAGGAGGGKGVKGGDGGDGDTGGNTDGGGGGGTLFGAGGAGGDGANGADGSLGSGGGGAGDAGAAFNGGAGGDGFVLVTW